MNSKLDSRIDAQQRLELGYLSRINLGYQSKSSQNCMHKFLIHWCNCFASASTNEKADKMSTNNMSSAKAIGQRFTKSN